jgi:hypothetical protein
MGGSGSGQAGARRIAAEGELAMKFWTKSVWWIAGVVALSCLFALTRTAQTSSGSGGTASVSGPEYFTVQGEGQSGVAYGVTENGHSVIYNRSPSDPADH